MGCAKGELGEERAQFYAQYEKAMKDRKFDVRKVVRVMRERLRWAKGGGVEVVGGGDIREVECVIFGFIPVWLVRGVERALKDEEKVAEWLRRHGAFMKQWFWKQWREFREEEANDDESSS